MNEVFKFITESIDDILLTNGMEKVEINENSKIIQDIGLKSLDIAQLFAILEAEYDKDPFSSGMATLADVVTVGDLCKLYE